MLDEQATCQRRERGKAHGGLDHGAVDAAAHVLRCCSQHRREQRRVRGRRQQQGDRYRECDESRRKQYGGNPEHRGANRGDHNDQPPQRQALQLGRDDRAEQPAKRDSCLRQPDDAWRRTVPAQRERDREDHSGEGEVDQRRLDDHRAQQRVMPDQVQPRQ
jgi:hypothetical protein